MDATDLDAFVDALIDDLTPVPARDEDRTLFHLLDCPRRVIDEHRLLAVLAGAVAARNLVDHVIAQAVAAAERAGIPARKHLRTGADLLTSLGVTPGAAYRAARVGRAAHTMPALTAQQRLGGVGIEFADAVGKGVAHINARVALSDEDRAEVVTKLMIETTPAAVQKKARAIAIATAKTRPVDDGAVPVAENTDLNDMTVVQTGDGRVSAGLDLDILTAEELMAALDPLCRPIPLPDGSPDPRPAGRRRADAFGQIIRDYLSGQRRPTSGGVLPQVTLIRPAASVGSAAGAEGSVDSLGFTGPVSTRTADLIACDSTLTTVLVDHSGIPLDLGAPSDCSPRRCAKPWASATGAAHSPAAAVRCPGAMPTTSSPGAVAGTPASTTVCCCADCTTPRSTTAAGRSTSAPTATPGSSHLTTQPNPNPHTCDPTPDAP